MKYTGFELKENGVTLRGVGGCFEVETDLSIKEFEDLVKNAPAWRQYWKRQDNNNKPMETKE